MFQYSLSAADLGLVVLDSLASKGSDRRFYDELSKNSLNAAKHYTRENAGKLADLVLNAPVV